MCPALYTVGMSVAPDELHAAIDALPDDQVVAILADIGAATPRKLGERPSHSAGSE